MLADLYDFDKTIFDGESGTAFWLFCLKRHPKIIKYLPRQLKGLFGHYVFHKISKERSKELFYSYLPCINAKKEAELFWEKNSAKIFDWFPLERDIPIVVCSASPLFQIKPICDKFGVDKVIATKMDPETGKIIGNNCKGEEKVRRIKEELPEYDFRNAFSDNIISDAPMLSLASGKKYQIKHGGTIIL